MASSSFQGGTFGRSPDNITVSLTPTNSDDQRIIQLKPGVPFNVGRASRSAYRHLPELEDNALFDCPVVSRTHAELRLSPWTKDQVTIADKSSLHGTSVNGCRLHDHTPFTLKPGDIIKLGDRVAKGDDAHDGIALTFDILHDTTSSMFPSHTALKSRGFHVPDESDRSDFESDLESIESDLNERSSAKTTPEQPKAGSQQQPTNLDLPAHGTVSNDHDSHDEEVVTAAQAADFRIIPESIDQGTILIEESVSDSAKAGPAEEGDHDIRSQYNMSAWELDNDYSSRGIVTNAQTQSPEDHQSLTDDSAQGRITDQATSYSDAYRSAGHQRLAELSPRKQPYDPVRGFARQDDRTAEAAQAQHMRFHNYTYGARTYAANLSGSRTDQHDSSRWDVPPVLSRGTAMPEIPLNLGFNNAWHDDRAGNFDMYSTAPTAQQSSSDPYSSDADVQADIAVVDGSSGAVTSKGKMPIDAMLRSEEQPVYPAVAASSVSADAEVFIESRPNETNKKRKAADVGEAEDAASPTKRVARADPDSSLSRHIAPSRTSTVAKEAGKFVVSAISGAIAFGFFLHSSYSERLMEYLE